MQERAPQTGSGEGRATFAFELTTQLRSLRLPERGERICSLSLLTSVFGRSGLRHSPVRCVLPQRPLPN